MKRLISVLIALVVLAVAVPARAGGNPDYIPTLDPALRRHVQMELKKQGFYLGPIDGIIGSGSLAALARFRSEKGISRERITYSDKVEYYPPAVLSPKLIKALWNVDFELDDPASQYGLMRRLGVAPEAGDWDPYVPPEE